MAPPIVGHNRERNGHAALSRRDCAVRNRNLALRGRTLQAQLIRFVLHRRRISRHGTYIKK